MTCHTKKRNTKNFNENSTMDFFKHASEMPVIISLHLRLQNCQCVYQCAGGEIQGHECCPPGLVFNPDALVCDWPFNVPDCDIL